MPTIGKYEILEQLGSGSMGTVYKGRDALLDRMVAIKTIRTGVNVELEAKERFYREARTCARLNHPHIVSVYDLGEENGTSFIVMELLSGSDFRQLIERRESLPLTVKLKAMAQVCEALAHAHREGIIHRDIKPSNLFLLSDHRAKVVDFGIAKLPTSHLTRAGAILGTPNYMAPEQINGSACDGRADLFSAAVVFFEFLTFEHPFKSNLIPRRILEDTPDSLFKHDPSLPRVLEKVFARAMAKSPDQRYATGDEFAGDLRAVIDAIAMNASPTFSRVELPSQSSLAVPPPIPESEMLVPQANGGPDNHEWRVNRMLKLLPTFEAQVAGRDSAAARATLAEMQSVAGEDSRYKDTIDNCRVRLVHMESSQASSSPKVRCQKCANINSPDATFCVGCGAALPPGPGTGIGPKAVSPTAATAAPPPPRVNPVAPPPPPPANVAAAKVTSINRPEIRTEIPADSRTAAKPIPPAVETGRPPQDHKRLFLVIGAVVAAALLLVVAPAFFRSEKQLPFVATARVAAQRSRIMAQPSAGSKLVESVDRGAVVNVISLPASLSQGWVKVQARLGSKVSAQGFANTADLTEWDSKEGGTALAIARLSGPLDSGTDAEMRAQADKLNSVAATFTGTPAAAAASLEAAKLELALAKHQKELNPTGADWQSSLTALTSRLEDLRKDSSVQGSADDLLRQAHDLAGGATPEAQPPAGADTGSPVPGTPPDKQAPTTPAAPPAPLTDAEVKYFMGAAQQALKDSRYNDALSAVQRVLRSQPQNSDAKALRNKIKEQIDFERSLR